MWRRPRTPGTFYVQARPAAHLDPRYDVGADDVGDGPKAQPPHLLRELRAHPSIVSRWKPCPLTSSDPNLTRPKVFSKVTKSCHIALVNIIINDVH